MNKFKYSTFGQMVDVLKTHLINAVLFSFLWLALVVLWTKGVGAYIYVGIALLCYAFSIYGCGERAAKNDNKTYVKRGMSIKRSLLIPLLLIGIDILVMILFKLTWLLGSDGEAISSLWAVFTNLFSYAWVSPFGTLAGMDKGNMSVLGMSLIILMPEIFFVLGYYASTKNYDIHEKLFGFMYEKKKNK